MSDEQVSRRGFLGTALRVAGVTGMGGALGAYALTQRAEGGAAVWQIDPAKCTKCGKCATSCVLNPSAVKCFHTFAICGYCDLCTGYFEPNANALTTAAENQLCPTAAIKRTFVEDPYYEFKIDRTACIGCAKCVKGCKQFGNGSLYLQVDHSVCVHCNWCSIATACPAGAFVRIPAKQAYIDNKIRTA